ASRLAVFSCRDRGGVLRFDQRMASGPCGSVLPSVASQKSRGDELAGQGPHRPTGFENRQRGFAGGRRRGTAVQRESALYRRDGTQRGEHNGSEDDVAVSRRALNAT